MAEYEVYILDETDDTEMDPEIPGFHKEAAELIRRAHQAGGIEFGRLLVEALRTGYQQGRIAEGILRGYTLTIAADDWSYPYRVGTVQPVATELDPGKIEHHILNMVLNTIEPVEKKN